MSWDYRKVRELCKEKNLPCPEIYLNSLTERYWEACYHAEQAQKVWDEFKSAHPSGYQIGGSNEEWWRAYYASAAETQAAVEALHAEADIIAQIINQIILRGSLREHKVTFRHVLDRLRKQNLATNVVAEIEAFRNSREFKYINAFCNTIKHRRLINKEWRVEGRARCKEGVRFLAFAYEEDNFPVTWASDINGSYRESWGHMWKELEMPLLITCNQIHEKIAVLNFKARTGKTTTAVTSLTL